MKERRSRTGLAKSQRAAKPELLVECWQERVMSDGREEREEEEKRRERESWKDREDALNRDRVDQWVPERKES